MITIILQHQTPNYKSCDKSPSIPSGSQENDQHNAQQQAKSLMNCIQPASAGSGDGLNSSFLFGTYSTGIKQQQHQESLGGSDKCTTMASATTTNDKMTELSSKLPKNHLKERPTKEREREGGGGGKFSVLQKWLRGDDKAHSEKRSSPGRFEFLNITIVHTLL